MADETQTTTEETTTQQTEQTDLEKELVTQTSSTQETDTTEKPEDKETKDATAETEEEETSSEEEEDKSAAGEEDELTVDNVFNEVELPEGYEFIKDDPLAEEFVNLLNDKEATKADLGTKLAGLYAKALQSNTQRWFDTQAEWQDELKNDPNIGGEKLEPAIAKIDTLIHEYASSHKEDAATVEEDLRVQFGLTGAGNNPNIFRFLHWAASQLGEGEPLSGGSVGGERSRAERMFGT